MQLQFTNANKSYIIISATTFILCLLLVKIKLLRYSKEKRTFKGPKIELKNFSQVENALMTFCVKLVP